MMLAVLLSLALIPQTVEKSNTVSAVATIQAIDATKRVLTIKDESGVEDTVYVGPEVKRFNELKVGDKISVRPRVGGVATAEAWRVRKGIDRRGRGRGRNGQIALRHARKTGHYNGLRGVGG